MTSATASHLSAHTEVWTLLPWYVNGTLEGAQLKLVQRHIGACITCRREIVILHRTADTIRSVNEIEVSAQVSLSRLMHRIKSEPHSVYSGKARGNDLYARWMRLASWLSLRLTARPALVTSSLVIVVLLSALSAKLWLVSNPIEPPYRTLASETSASDVKRNDIHVIFSRPMTQFRIRRLLDQVHGQIVDGPNSAGAYTVGVASGKVSDKEFLQALNRLRHDSRVLLAEPSWPAKMSER